MGIWIRHRPFVIFFLLFTFLWILTGCDKNARYGVLNFFFDGVPHPDEQLKKEEPASAKTAKAGQLKRAELPPETPRYKHPPAEGKDDCSFCHGSISRIVIPPKDICLKCHEHLKEKRPFIHGPAAVDCVVCHNVHESETKTLLRKIGNILCFDCHSKEEIQKADPHKELKEEELVCLSCHDPHGGKDKFFLK
ncbi:MAG: cytochrome c3 family protein [Thermodesulfobacteriota bacterium]